MQVEAIGIQFDYKKESHFLWRINVVCIVLSLLCIATIYNSYDSFSRSINTAIEFTDYFVSTSLQNFIIVQISISFTVLLHSLYKRFAMLNKCLRYAC